MATTPTNRSRFGRAERAATGRLREEIRDRVLGGIGNNRARSAASQLLNAIDPRLVGGSLFSDGNVFSQNFTQRTNQLLAEIDQAGTASTAIVQDTDNLAKNYDWRARLRPKNGGAERFYAASLPGGKADYLMRPIQDSGGLVFPITPTFFMNGVANYVDNHMQGMQYPINTYNNSSFMDMMLTADFTANDVYEARYLLATMTFLKVATHGYFGDVAASEGKAGAPPPVMIFEYLGDHVINKVPVVVTSYNLTFQQEVDYIPVEIEDTVSYVPTVMSVVVNLKPQYTPRKLRTQYDIESIANGRGYEQGFL